MKRLTALLLALVMVISILPIHAFASEDGLTGVAPPEEETLVQQEPQQQTDPAPAEKEKVTKTAREYTPDDSETVDIHVRVVWNDDNNAQGDRPFNVGVHLYRNDIYESSAGLFEYNDWSYTFVCIKGDDEDVTYSIDPFMDSAIYTETITEEDGGFVITYTRVSTIETPVRVVWMDHNNAEGLRPDLVTFAIYQNNVHFDHQAIRASDNWTGTLKLPELDADGEAYVYRITVDGKYSEDRPYTAAVTKENGAYVITMVRNTMIDIPVRIVWNDDNDAKGQRPDSVYVRLYKDDVWDGDLNVADSDNWSRTFSQKPKYNDSGEVCVYRVGSSDVPYGYTETVTEENGGFVITYSLDSLINIPVQIVWDDDNDRRGHRPEYVFLWLLKDGEQYRDTSVDSYDNWQHTFENLQKRNASGEEYDYSMEASDGSIFYTKTITEENGGFVVTYSHLPTKDIPVKVLWVDNDNAEGDRPSSVGVQLYRDDMYVNSTSMSASKDWAYTFSLPENSDNEGCTYKIIPNLYSSIYTAVVTEEDGGFVITCTRAATKDIPVRIVWDDNNNAEGDRPVSVMVDLFQYETYIEEAYLTADSDWSHTFKVRVDNDVEDSRYNIKPYVATPLYKVTVTRENGGFVITYTHIPAVEIPVSIVWDDNNNAAGDRPQSVDVDLYKDGDSYGKVYMYSSSEWSHTFKVPKYNDTGDECAYSIKASFQSPLYKQTITKENGGFVITMKRVSSVDIPVWIVWDDNDNAANNRPNDVYLSLLNAGASVLTSYVDEDDDWEHTFKAPKYDDNGKEVVYSIKARAEHYTQTVKQENGGFVITLTYVAPVDIPVKILWEDDNNAKGDRPSEIFVNLFADGVYEACSYLYESDEWEDTFKKCRKLNDAGEEIAYSVRADYYYTGPLDPYTQTITREGNGFVITLTRIPTKDIPVRIVWEDDHNAQGLRPDGVSVSLFENGSYQYDEYFYEGNDWSYTFKQPLTAEESTYKIRTYFESPLYTESITEEDGGFVITYTMVQTMDIPMRVVWDDNNNAEGDRPGGVHINLNKNGEYISGIYLDEESGWTHTFKAPKTDEKDAYSLRVIYINSPLYRETITRENGVFVVTLTRVPTVNIPVRLVWDDNDNAEGDRPDEVDVELYIDGDYFSSTYLDKNDEDWECTFTAPKYRNDGEESTYSVMSHTGSYLYKETVTREGTGFVITLTRVPSVNIPVRIVWDDNDDAEGDRPYGVEIDLCQDGEVFSTWYMCRDDQSWEYTFKAPKYRDDGKEITYSVKSRAGTPLYKETVTQENGVFVITLTRVPSVSIPVRIVWDDKDDAENYRPSYVTVTLCDGDTGIIDQNIYADESWKGTAKVPKYDDNGKEIVYSIKTDLEYYNQTITKKDDGFVITFTYDTAIDIPVEIVWVDDDDLRGERPSSVELHLYADESSRDYAEVDDFLEWSYTFRGMPRVSSGEEISYSIKTYYDYEGKTPYIETIARKDGGFVITYTYKVADVPEEEPADPTDPSEEPTDPPKEPADDPAEKPTDPPKKPTEEPTGKPTDKPTEGPSDDETGSNPSTPATGDSAHLVLWRSLFMVSLTALAVASFLLQKKRKGI